MDNETVNNIIKKIDAYEKIIKKQNETIKKQYDIIGNQVIIIKNKNDRIDCLVKECNDCIFKTYFD